MTISGDDATTAAANGWMSDALAAGGTGIFRLDLRAGTWEWTPQVAVLFGLDPMTASPRSKDWENTIFSDDVPKVRAAIKTATKGGACYVELRVRHPDRSVHWLAGKARAKADDSGRARWIFGSCFEITDRKALDARLLAFNEALEARVAEVREEARTLEILNRIGVAIAAELNLQRLVQTVTDAGVELVRAQFGAFFYNTRDAQGETYTLRAISGVPREAFAKFPKPRNTAVFGPTFRGESAVRSDDILADPRYGKNAPYFGMPAGHPPVRSYLAVPVTSRSGEVLGGLFFGHGNRGVFSERSERIMTVIAAQAAVAIDNAQLHQDSQQQIAARTKAELALQKLNETLEQRVEKRTRQLLARSAQLRESEERFRLLIDATTDYAIFMLDRDGNVMSWNAGAQRIKGYAAEEILGAHFSRFYTDEDRRNGVPAIMFATALQNGKCETEGWRVRKDGTAFWASVVIAAIRDSSGKLLGFAKITRDLTERRASEERLRQAQKMEAIGQLTGGVAHDFNNLLTVISGNIEAIVRDLPETARNLRRRANAALHGARRATELTQRLLAFARRQALEPASLSINELVTGMLEMLRRTLGENIAVETVLDVGAWSAFVDANQLESAILNLAINARDAMPDGGKLTIRTANVQFDDDEDTASPDIPSGQYVGLFVGDTGTGMTAETMSKAFDPFFATKEIGQGTGLGLSQVYGFIRQSGGNIKIDSEVGAGTTLNLYLPRHDHSETMTADHSESAPIPRAKEETILVAEDDPDVRNFTVEMLRELEYRVVEAPDGPTALRLLDAHREIVLLFTDVGLPGGMNGRQLADEARRRRPDLKVLYTSGYARGAIVHHDRLDAGVELLVKPFNFASLAARIRRILDQR